MKPSRNLYPTDVGDDEWAFVAPYLILLPEDAGQRTYSLHEVFNGLRWITRAGVPCRSGTWCINKRSGGRQQVVLPLWTMICDCCCGKPKSATGSPRRLSLRVGPGHRRQKAVMTRFLLLFRFSPFLAH